MPSKDQATEIEELVLYSPHEKQLQIHNCKKRFAIASFGRQSGKSTYAINEMLKCAWEKDGTKYWFVSPTYTQSRVMYRRLIGMLWPCRDIMVKKNQTELRVKLTNESEIRFVSGEVFDNLRGETLNGAIIDEVREQHPDLWPMVIRPMLATTKGWCRFVSTPNGYDHFYDLAQKAKAEPEEWELFIAPSTANPLFSQEEFEASKRTLSEPQFAQEILAEFRSLTAGRVYFAYGPQNLTEECPFAAGRTWSQYHTIVLGLDFNVSPMSWCIGQYVQNIFWWFDEIRLMDSNTQEAANALRDKILIMKDQGLRAPQDLIICGDASGNARSTKSNESDYQILKGTLKEAGITFRDLTPEANPSIKDRVNSVNAKCKSASGDIGLYIHPTYCKWLAKDLERVTWKPGADFTLDPGKKRELTHMSDAMGYPIFALAPIKAVRDIGKSKILMRSF